MEILKWTTEWVSAIGDWLSFLTFLVSIYTVLTLRSVRSELISKAMLPRYIELLSQEASNLSTALADFSKNKTEIEISISRSLVNVKAIGSKTNGPTKARAKALFKQMQIVESGRWFGSRKELNQNNARAIYISIVALVEQMNRLADEQRFGA